MGHDGMSGETESGKPESGEAFDPVLVSVAAYTDHAGAYEAVHAPKMADTVARFARSLPVPSRILDAGCGPGRDLARFVAHGHDPIGVDLNAAFVALANAHAPTSRSDLRVVASHFPPASFDGIWASASLVHLLEHDTIRVIEQFAQLLRPGGKLFACLKRVGDTGWLDEPDGRRWYTVWDADAFAGAIAGAGFVVDRIERGAFVEVWATRRG